MIPLEAIIRFARTGEQERQHIVIISFNNEKEGNAYTTRPAPRRPEPSACRQARSHVDNVKDEPLMYLIAKPGKIKKEVKSKKFGYDILTLATV